MLFTELSKPMGQLLKVRVAPSEKCFLLANIFASNKANFKPLRNPGQLP